MKTRLTFPLSRKFHKGLWRKWDNLTSEARQAIEKTFEQRDNYRVKKLVDNVFKTIR